MIKFLFIFRQTYHSRYEPYQKGEKCSSCKKNCVNGLCDCKGVYCLNGGTMDLNTCTCTCPYSTFSGKYCENGKIILVKLKIKKNF